MLGYQVSNSENAYDFFYVFFQSDRPTQYQETHSTVNEKKRGWPNGNGPTANVGKNVILPNFSILRPYCATLTRGNTRERLILEKSYSLTEADR